jgi:hypothetical protein
MVLYFSAQGLRHSAWFAKVRPSLHHCAALFDSVSAPIGRLGFVLQRMRQSLLGEFTRKVGLLRYPIPEG